jgi:hypothetical protein
VANKEIHVPFEALGNAQQITGVNKRLFAEHDMDIHKNEVVDLIDDHDTKKRIYKLRKVKFFGPWSHRG